MRVLHLSTNDTSGGAARAAYRLHTGFQANGIDSRMLVQKKNSDDESVYGASGLRGKLWTRVRQQLDQFPLRRYRNRDSELFSPAWTPERRAKQIAKHDPDIVHLHWIGGGFIRPATIATLDVPVVWTLHDMWPFTGGCHYAKSCTKYENECGACPHLGSDRQSDLANGSWERKRRAWAEADPVVVTPSRWLGEEAGKSSLLGGMEIEVIPHGLDIEAFRPRSREAGVRRLGLDANKRYILFGAAYDTPRKGGDLLSEALKQFNESENIAALTFGKVNFEADISDNLSIDIIDLGWLSELELQLIYSTASVTVVPSKQEAFGQTTTESLASGTPVVAFDTTGPSSLIEHKKTGYLAEPFDPDSFAEGIEWIISNPERTKRLSQQARQLAKERYAIDSIVEEYRQLFEQVLNES